MPLLILIISVFIFTGCLSGVKPWEKETLGKATMSEDGTNALLNKFEEHIFFSKEASKGGNGVAGGGCGCN